MSACEQRIETIVLEGGPCAGKSTGIPRIKKHFKGLGWMVLVSSEVPTRLVNEHDYVPGENITTSAFQELVLGEVIRQETELLERARTSGHEKVLILCDRGRFGGLGYTEKHEDFYTMAKEKFGLGKNALFRQYSGCVFLQSPAVDAPEVYLKHMKGNEARREDSVEKAVRQNFLSLDACVGVSRMFIVDNSTDFDGKTARVIGVIEHMLAGVEYEKKYVPISPRSLGRWPTRRTLLGSGVHFMELAITQGYLTVGEADVAQGVTTRRLRTESLGGDPEPLYIFTLKGEKKEGGGSERESFISEVEHAAMQGATVVDQYIARGREERRALRGDRFCGHHIFLVDGPAFAARLCHDGASGRRRKSLSHRRFEGKNTGRPGRPRFDGHPTRREQGGVD
jgi:thymidylate kinase